MIDESPLVTIRIMAETFAVNIVAREAIKKIVEAGHLQILLYSFMALFGTDTKKKCLWLVGVANSGKSSFVRLLSQILATDEVVFKSGLLPLQIQTKPN